MAAPAKQRPNRPNLTLCGVYSRQKSAARFDCRLVEYGISLVSRVCKIVRDACSHSINTPAHGGYPWFESDALGLFWKSQHLFLSRQQRPRVTQTLVLNNLVDVIVKRGKTMFGVTCRVRCSHAIVCGYHNSCAQY